MRVQVELRGPFGRRAAVATTLGAGGLFVATDAPLPVGETLEVAFQLPDDGVRRRIDARVAWTLPVERAGPDRGAGMGLAFTDPVEVASLAHALDAETTATPV